MPYAVFVVYHLENAVSRAVVRYFMNGADMDLEGTGVCNVQLCREVIAVICGGEATRLVSARCLVVAVTKSGVVPSYDLVEDARAVARVVRDGGADEGDEESVE